VEPKEATMRPSGLIIPALILSALASAPPSMAARHKTHIHPKTAAKKRAAAHPAPITTQPLAGLLGPVAVVPVVPSPAIDAPPAPSPSLVRNVQDFNLWLHRAQQEDRNRSEAARQSMNDFNLYLKAIDTGDEGQKQWAKNQQDIDDASRGRFSDKEVADMKAALKLYDGFKSDPAFAQFYAEGAQCFSYGQRTPALNSSGAADLCFIIPRSDLH